MKKQAKWVISSAFMIVMFILIVGAGCKTTLINATVASNKIPRDSAPALSLHVSGNKILDSDGNIVYLRGTDYTWFVNFGGFGSWLASDGSGSTDWNTWSQADADHLLSKMHSWGCNLIRVHATVAYWVDDTNNFREHLETFITDAAALGMYVEFTFWDITGTDSMPTGVLPWNVGGNAYLTSATDFVNLWTSVSSTLKSYNNVLFELWNEPNGADNLPADHSTDEVNWMSAAQSCITAMRATGATNNVVVQWGYGVGTGGFDMSWVTDYPLTDSSGNLIYSTHVYRSNFGSIYTLSDVSAAYTTAELFSLSYPLFVGEIGCDMSAGDLANEETWYANSLSLFNQHGLSYAGFTAPPNDDPWDLVAASTDYTPNAAGTILINAIAAGGTSGAPAVTFASVGGNAPISYIPVTLTNNQNAPTPANFQQEITTNPSLYPTSFTPNLANVNWQDGNGTVLNSWLESGASSGSSSTVYWVNLGYRQIPASGGNLTIYEVIYGTGVNAMNNLNTGAFPTYNGIYGQDDDGAAVFPTYSNFTGPSLPAGFAQLNPYAGSLSATVSNGLTLAGVTNSTGQNNAIHIYTSAATSNKIVEVGLAAASLQGGSSFELALNTIPPANPNDAGFRTAYRFDSRLSAYRLISDVSSAGTTIGSAGSVLTLPAVETLIWPATGNETGQFNYTTETTSVDSAITFANSYADVCLVSSSLASSSFTVNWMRTRVYPPGGVLPAVTFWTLTPCPSSTISPNNSPIDQGQSSTLTSVVSGGVGSYSYQWFAEGPGAGSYSLLSGAAAASYIFASTTSNATGAWDFILQVTDSAERPVAINSSAATVTLNAPLAVPAPVMDSISPSTSTTGNITLSWSSVAGATSYSVCRSTSTITSISGLTAIATGVTATTYQDKLSANGTYYYVVVASGSSGISNCVSCSVAIPPASSSSKGAGGIPAAPAGLFLGVSALSVLALVNRVRKKKFGIDRALIFLLRYFFFDLQFKEIKLSDRGKRNAKMTPNNLIRVFYPLRQVRKTSIFGGICPKT